MNRSSVLTRTDLFRESIGPCSLNLLEVSLVVNGVDHTDDTDGVDDVVAHG